MAGKYELKSGAQYMPSYNWEPGMNDELSYEDRAGYTTSFEGMNGITHHAFWGSGPEVAPSNYEMDPMGEERNMATFSADDPMAKGYIGMAGAEGGAGMQDNASYVTTTGGKKMAEAPQNYNSVGMSKKGD